MAYYLISQIGEYNREIAALIISIILVLLFIEANKIYKHNQMKLLDDNVQEIYNEIEEELFENIKEGNFEGPIIDLETKIDVYCKKRKIDKKQKEKIVLKLNDLIISESSNLKKHFIYLDGKVISYVKLRNAFLLSQN